MSAIAGDSGPQIPAHIPAIGKLWLPIGILALAVAITVGLFLAARNAAERDGQHRFDRQAADAKRVIEIRLRSYVDATYALRAFFASREKVSRAEFHNYVESLDLKGRYPGFEVLNYARHVAARDRRAFENEVRRDKSLDPRGYPNFSIRPPGERPEHHVLVYLEPLEGNQFAFGLDIGVGPNQARAQAMAIDSGALTSTGRLLHVGINKFVGISMRLIHYRTGAAIGTIEQRRAAVVGSVGAGFNVLKLMGGVLNETTMKGMRFRLYDLGTAGPARAGKPSLLFDSEQARGGVPQDDYLPVNVEDSFTKAISLQHANRVWEVHFSSPKSAFMEPADTQLPWVVLAGGLLSSVLLFIAMAALASSRERAFRIAREITGVLRQSEADLAQAQVMARLGRWTFEPGTEKFMFSVEAAKILGLADSERVVDMNDFTGWLSEEYREVFTQAITVFPHGRHSRSEEVRMRLPGRDSSWAYFMFEPDNAARAGQGCLRGIIMDITERKRTSIRLELEKDVTQILSSGDGTDEIVTRILEKVCVAFGWQCGSFWQFLPRDAKLRHTNSWSIGRPDIAGFLSFAEHSIEPGSHSAVAMAYAQREPVVVQDLSGDPDATRARAAVRVGFQANINVPIDSSGQIFGILEFFSLHPIRPDESRSAYLKSLGNQIGQYFQRKQAEERLRHVAAHDALTNLPNRMTFSDALQRAIRRASRQRSGIALLFIDIDRFKLVNDTLGHNAGDLVLQECASRLNGSLRESDMIARLGGDEFVVLLESSSGSTDAVAVARKILESLAAPFFVENQEFQLSASIGVSTYPEDGDEAGTLLRNADVAMYRAKEQGRNTYRFYAAQMNQHTFERLALESSLRKAVERGELLLHFQPKVSMAGGNLTGMEALLRWRHPELGMVSPSQFIPLAEETGLIVPIGEWVLREACRQMSAWRDQGFPALRVAVNLSARQFAHATLSRDIQGILTETGAKADSLELEITESMVMTQAENSIRVLGELKAMGVHIAIDDFGTGYSSLAYLKRFPIDSVKIDRSFVHELPDDPDDAAITRGIIALSHSLRLNVIAEGVETREQWDFLESCGCDEVQGYLFSKPVSAAEAGAMQMEFARRASVVEPRKLA